MLLMVGGGVYNLDVFDRVMVVGAGKASASMARAVEEVLGEKIDQGILVVKYGHAGKLDDDRTDRGGPSHS